MLCEYAERNGSARCGALSAPVEHIFLILTIQFAYQFCMNGMLKLHTPQSYLNHVHHCLFVSAEKAFQKCFVI